MKSLYISLFFLSAFNGSSALSQEVLLVDSLNTPIKGVFLTSKSNPSGAFTDKSGRINISAFSANEYIRFLHSSFISVVKSKEELVTNSTVVLKYKTNELNPVYINHSLRYFLVEEDEPGQIQTISIETARLENPTSTADLLQNSGNILVQKSQGGGGSPIIRGFEANKLLLVVDGVRMNNAIYRSGHLQNSITIDNEILDKVDIIFGPSSSLYGSDALGGVMHFHTKDPKITHSDTLLFYGSSLVRYNSNASRSANFNFSMSKKKWGLLSSFTAKEMNDFKMGTKRDHGYDNWGKHTEYVAGYEGKDSVFRNPDPTLQKFAGFTQFDFLEKFVYEASEKLKLTLNFQYSTSTNIFRYDKLTEYRNGELRWAEWYYGPQKRLFSALKLDLKPEKKWANKGAIALSYQRIDEDRVGRRFESDFREFQQEDVHVISLNMDFNKIFTKSRMLFYGAEVQQNVVYSASFEENIFSSERTAAQTRYPENSSYLSSGIYLEYKQKFGRKSTFSAGMRYSVIAAQSEFNDTSFIQLPFNTVNFVTSAPSGHVGVVFKPDTNTFIKPSLTSGFRAPNIDDYGKVFEQDGVTVVPNDEIKPELAVGAELTIKRNFLNKLFALSGTIYSTYLFNAIVRRPFELNGQDSIFYNGENTQIQANTNTDESFLYGISSSLHINFSERFNFMYTYNYTKGTDLTNNIPLSHIAPQFGKIAFTYVDDHFNTSVYTYYNFRKKLDNYGGGPDNLDLTPNEEGTPPWYTLNFRISYTFLEHFTAQFAVENIFDIHYRQFASGISAPGRNFMGAIRFNF